MAASLPVTLNNSRLVPKSHLLQPPQNPNPTFLLPIRRTTTWSRSIRCSTAASSAAAAAAAAQYEPERMTPHPRPQEVAWSKELANSVNLIGVVGAPVQMKQLASGKSLAWTRLAVKKSATDTTWINLTFWDDLAHMAFQHVEKGKQIYVLGRLVSDTVEGDEENQQRVFYKVVVQKLNFVEKSFPPPISLYEPELGSLNQGRRLNDFVEKGNGSTEELWQAFFANPLDWWDNRQSKKNPKYPDFKHKDTGEALWIEGKYNPPWVKSQLAILDSRMASAKANDTSPFSFGDKFTPF